MMKLNEVGKMSSIRSELFHSALDLCVDAYNMTPAPELRLKLASAALLFAQVEEHLARGNSLSRETVAHCHSALNLVRDDIETLLTRNRNQPQDAPQSPLAAE